MSHGGLALLFPSLKGQWLEERSLGGLLTEVHVIIAYRILTTIG